MSQTVGNELNSDTEVVDRKMAETIFREILTVDPSHTSNRNDREFEVMSNSKIIKTQQELRAAFCQVVSGLNETREMTDQKSDKISKSDFRKINTKLLQIEEKLEKLAQHIENSIIAQMSLLSQEILKAIKSN